MPEDSENSSGIVAVVTPGELGFAIDSSGNIRPSLEPGVVDYFMPQPDYPLSNAGGESAATGPRFLGSELLAMGSEVIERQYFENQWTGEIEAQNLIVQEGGSLYSPRANAVSEDGGATWKLAEPEQPVAESQSDG